MIMRSILILTVAAAVLVGPYSIQSSVAQGPPKPKPYTPTPSYIFGTSSCSAQGSPPCSISCPTGKTAVCNNGGLIPGQCLCR